MDTHRQLEAKRHGRIVRGRGILLAGILSAALGLSLPGVAEAIDTPLSETPEIQFSSPAAQDLRDKAEELSSPVKIYEYVRNNHEYQLYHGSRSGSTRPRFMRAGNPPTLWCDLIVTDGPPVKDTDSITSG